MDKIRISTLFFKCPTSVYHEEDLVPWLRSNPYPSEEEYSSLSCPMYYRLQRFSRCIHWICRCRRCEQRCGRSLRDTAMWIRYMSWICYYFRVMPNFRYDPTPYLSRGVHRLIFGLLRVTWTTAPVVMQRGGLGRWAITVAAWPLTKCRSSGNVELLEAITAYSQILPRKRRFRGEAASKFHAVFLRGKAT